MFVCLCSLGGPNGYVPIGLPDDKLTPGQQNNAEPVNMKRARVLCSYDASGSNELNLTANEVSGGQGSTVECGLNLVLH